MRNLAIGLMVVIIALGFSFLRNYKKRNVPREFKTTDEFIQWLASEAVKDAEVNNHLTLDYSPDSIRAVDQILGKLHDQYVRAPLSISVRGLAASYGAYIGEVIRKNEPNVHWERDDPVMGEKVYPLHWASGNSYPMAWCQKRIVNGEEDDVWVKYTVLRDRKSTKSF